jgi:nuclear pore complex protein Nup107
LPTPAQNFIIGNTARGRITAAAGVHNELPSQLLNPAPASPNKVNLDQQETEHGDFKRFFAVWAACANVETMAEDEGRGGFDFTLGLNDNTYGGGWKRRFKTRVDEVRSAVVDLLTSSWLLFIAVDPEDHSQRAQELRKIRKIFIPELVMRLTRVLQKARKHYPEYVLFFGLSIMECLLVLFFRSVAHAMELANILADGKYELYLCFVSHEGNRMGRYLTVLQELLLDALQIGGSDPLAPLMQVN